MVWRCLYSSCIFRYSVDCLCSFSGWMVSLITYLILEILEIKYIFRYVFAGVLGPVLLIIIFVIVINVLQAYKLNWLPKGLQTWLWLPRPLRSLGWYDEHLFSKKCLCCKKKQVSTTIDDHDVHQNQVFNDQDQEFV